jgi:hypothetical protein
MDTTKIRDWLEIVGMFGVIASLIFVGMEMRQSHQIAIASTNGQRTDTAVQLTSTMATDPVFRSAFAKAQSGEEDSWTEDEAIAFWFLSGASFRTYSDTYWHYLNGFVPQDRWLAVRAELKNGMANIPAFRARVENTLDLSGPVRQMVDEIIAEIDSGE